MPEETSSEAMVNKLPIINSILASYSIPTNTYTLSVYKQTGDMEFNYILIPTPSNGHYFTGSVLADIEQEGINIKN